MKDTGTRKSAVEKMAILFDNAISEEEIHSKRWTNNNSERFQNGDYSLATYLAAVRHQSGL